MLKAWNPLCSVPLKLVEANSCTFLDLTHFTISISDNTSTLPSATAPLPVFLRTPSIAHHASNSKNDPTHPKQDKKTQRQGTVCI